MAEEQGTNEKSVAPELGVFFIVSLILFFGFMRRTKGRVKYINAYISSRNWPFLQDEKALIHYMGLLKFIIVIILSWPAITLVVWVVTILIQDAQDYNDYTDLRLGISVFLVACSFTLVLAAFLNIKWQKFRINKSSLWMFCFGVLSYIAFQIILIFFEDDPSYFGMSAIFLGINGMIVIFLIFFTNSTAGETIDHLISQLPEGLPYDYPDDFVSAEQLINHDMEKEFTQADIYSTYTLPHATNLYAHSAVSGGLQAIFTKRFNKSKQKCIITTIYLVSLCVLVIYTALVYITTDVKGLGLVNSIAALTTDLIVYFYIYGDLSKGPFEAASLAIVCRIFLFCFGQTGWFIGYCCLYFMFTILLSWHVIQNRFPLLGQIVEKEKENADQRKLETRDVSRTPEFIWFLATILFLLLAIVIGLVDPDDIPDTTISIGDTDIAIYILAAGCVVGAVIIFCVMMTYRIFIRKMKAIVEKVHYFFYCLTFDLYWMFIIITVAIVWIAGIIGYALSGNETVIILFIFLPVILALILTGYANWVRNDYSVIMDVKEFNLKTEKQRKRDEEIVRRVEEYTHQYMDHMNTTGDMNFAQKTLSAKQMKEISQAGRSSGFQAIRENADHAEPDSPSRANVNQIQFGLIDPEELKSRLKQNIEDWSATMNGCSACCRGKLQKSDYAVLSCIFLALLLNVLMAVIDFAVTDSLTFGVSIAVVIVALCLVCFTLVEYFATSNPPGCAEWFSLLLGVALNFGYGIFYYVVELDGSDDQSSALNTLLLTFACPVLVSYITAFYKWKDNSWKLDCVVYTAFFLAQGFLALFAAMVGLLIDWLYGAIIFAVVFLASLYLMVAIQFVRSGFFLTFFWKLFALMVTALLCLVGLVVGLALDSIGKFLGFSISYFAIVVFLSIYALQLWIRTMKHKENAPIFFSPWVFPIYKYEPTQERMIEFNKPGISIYLIIFMIFGWSILATIWIQPVSVGVSVGSFCQVLLVLISVYISGISPIQLGTASRFINPNTDLTNFKQAWLDAKKRYLIRKGATYPDDVPSFRERIDKVHILEHIADQVRNGLSYEEPNRSASKAWLDSPDDLSSIRVAYAEMYNEDVRATRQYLHEIELIIHFQLLIVMRALSSKSNEVMFLNSLLNAKKVELKAFGIDIRIPEGISTVDKYTRALYQIENLDPYKRIRFENIRSQYQQELEEAKLLQQQKEEEERLRNEERSRKLAALRQQRTQAKQEQKSMQDVPIEQMVDSREKYAKIVAKFRQDHQKFSDNQFPANEQSLGPHAAQVAGQWKRAGEECVLYEGGVDPRDVKQGALGDCYFLSAMTVLGEKRVKEAFIDAEPDPKCGAYCVRFFDEDGDIEYVIVDDQFPVNAAGEWAFTRTVSGTELWPMLLEKAYAKLNGSYDAIVGGKVQFALADLTGGFPEQIKLESAQNNPDGLWKNMLKFKQLNYLIGAGSPENPLGDAVVTEMGIVQGHAYALLDVQEIDNEKLIQLKNPHGQHGIEWKGDWCDGSFKWNKKFKQKLNYEETDDGIFWMSLEDFVWEYQNLYICRLFDPATWLQLPNAERPLEAAWEGRSAAGLPCRQNPKVEFGDNPQYVLNVSKPSTLFVSLTQKNTVDMFKGKLFIVFMVYRGKKRIVNPGSKMVGSSGSPTDLKTVSAEINLDQAGDYVILCAQMLKGEAGHGEYMLKVVVDDKKAKLSELPYQQVQEIQIQNGSLKQK